MPPLWLDHFQILIRHSQVTELTASLNKQHIHPVTDPHDETADFPTLFLNDPFSYEHPMYAPISYSRAIFRLKFRTHSLCGCEDVDRINLAEI